MNYVVAAWLWLEGKKTYLISLVFALFNVLVQYNVINLTNRTIVVVNALLAAAGFTTLRLAIKNLN